MKELIRLAINIIKRIKWLEQQSASELQTQCNVTLIELQKLVKIINEQ